MPVAAALLDSSYVVRYLTNDPPDMAARAAAILDGEEPLILCETILMESAYVLEAVYEVDRPEIVEALAALVQKANLSMAHLPKPRVLEALELCRASRRVSFTDAMLWAEARERSPARVYTFDGRFPKHGITIA